MRPFFSLLFPKDSESLKIFDIRLWEKGAKRPLNGASKVNRHRDKQTHTHMAISTYRKHRPRGPMLWKLNMASMWPWVTKKLLKWEKEKNIFFHSLLILSTFLWKCNFFDSTRTELSPLRLICVWWLATPLHKSGKGL